jgi:predicted membrane chloride channel (bestrophin family)
VGEHACCLRLPRPAVPPDSSNPVQVLTCLQVLSDMVEATDMTDAQKFQMQQEITVFEDILGGCERLLRTPIPVSYTRHSTRMIMLWLTLFPVWLQHQIGPALIPTTALVAFLLLGVLPLAPSARWRRSSTHVC